MFSYVSFILFTEGGYIQDAPFDAPSHWIHPWMHPPLDAPSIGCSPWMYPLHASPLMHPRSTPRCTPCLDAPPDAPPGYTLQDAITPHPDSGRTSRMTDGQQVVGMHPTGIHTCDVPACKRQIAGRQKSFLAELL